MAAGNIQAYTSFVENMAKQNLDFVNDTIGMLLLDTAYTPDTQAHATVSDVSATEITDTDYARQTVTNPTISVDGSGRVVFDADNVSFGTNVSISAQYAVVFKDTGNDTTATLISYIDLNDGNSANVASKNSDFAVSFDSAGVYRITP